MNVAKATGMPIMVDLKAADELPHTLSFAISYRAKINSLQELPKDKRPPKNLWDKPHKLDEFLDKAFSIKDDNQTFVDFDTDDLD